MLVNPLLSHPGSTLPIAFCVFSRKLIRQQCSLKGSIKSGQELDSIAYCLRYSTVLSLNLRLKTNIWINMNHQMFEALSVSQYVRSWSAALTTSGFYLAFFSQRISNLLFFNSIKYIIQRF